jgi:hypothetical protein
MHAVRKTIAMGVGALSVAGFALALAGQGVAYADAVSDITNKYYGDAKQTLSTAGLTPIIATRVGDQASDDKCVVDRAQNANFVNGTGTAASNTVYVYLNCYANVAAPGKAGYSHGSVVGRQVLDSIAQQQAQQQQQSASEQNVTAQNQH